MAFDFETRFERQPEAGMGFQLKRPCGFLISGAEKAETP
jgi:hypothetical protein